MEREDIEFARLLHNESSVLMKLSDPSHVSESQQERWFETISLSASSERYIIYEMESGNSVGVFRVDNIDRHNRSVCVGLDVVENKRGLGYAKQSYNYFLDLFFNQKNFHRIYLATLETNDIALKLYKHLGFVEEGHSREAIYRDGRFQNLVWLSILACEWRHNALNRYAKDEQ